MLPDLQNESSIKLFVPKNTQKMTMSWITITINQCPQPVESVQRSFGNKSSYPPKMNYCDSVVYYNALGQKIQFLGQNDTSCIVSWIPLFETQCFIQWEEFLPKRWRVTLNLKISQLKQTSSAWIHVYRKFFKNRACGCRKQSSLNLCRSITR